MVSIAFDKLMNALDRTPKEFLKECPFAVIGIIVVILSITLSILTKEKIFYYTNIIGFLLFFLGLKDKY